MNEKSVCFGEQIPEVYQPGYAASSAAGDDSELVRNYLESTMTSDTVMDELLETLSSYGHKEMHRFIDAAMER